MPFKSRAQQAYMNAHRSEGVDVDEWNEASRGMKLPKHAKKKKRGATPEQMHELDGYIKGKYGNRA